MSARALAADLRRELGGAAVPDGDLRHYGHDATEAHGVHGTPAAVVLPADTAGVAAALRCCDRLGVAVVPRGGGTGLAAGAVPLGGEVVLGLERLTAVRALEPERWRMHVEAGLTTGHVHRLARESGLLFPPDPGAAEQSQIGGNVATNAGGPHAFKYGVTGRWVTGLEAVLASGEVLTVGGPLRKDVAGYDLRSLLVGSEGTLAVITAAWLALTPMPEARLPVAAAFDSVGAGCDAIDAIVASGLTPAILEYLDAGTLEAAGAAFPAALPAPARMLVIAEADGSAAEAARVRSELVEVLGDGALALHAPQARGDVEALWRWRDGVSTAVAAHRGGKMGEDVVVPFERLRDVIAATVEIGARHGLPACSWGHAGDGNVHATLLVRRDDAAELMRAQAAAEDLFAAAVALGGSVSGEHGLGWVKRGQLERQWAPAALDLHEGVKRLFDPHGRLNPGKKLARRDPPPGR
ncbi:FAD-binding oxidoreductase [Baekduia soli]|uniref:FAD-binding oxidoreductase n=1 Tax=Baekduia soli TaxID=496014 RepID=UPI0016528190|nr:FAD-linked oxidase C-terminal domain-containing protein [Baekduia soli]